MIITIIGSGYVGLVSGICLASKGHTVICVENQENKVELISSGYMPIYEKDLDTLFENVSSKNLFRITSNLSEALSASELVMIAVGTPDSEQGIDLNQVKLAAEEIGEFLKINDKELAIVVKSTVIPGTSQDLVKKIIEDHSGKKHPEFGIGMNPEFLREGSAVKDFMNPDRIVLGFEDTLTKKKLESLYAPWECEKLFVTTKEAEFTKYAHNIILAAQISLANELANIADEMGGIDFNKALEGVRLDRRWSPILESGRIFPPVLSYLQPGPGFGGSCFPKDVHALQKASQSLGYETKMLDAIIELNTGQPKRVTKLLEQHLSGLGEENVLVLGLAFKPDTDDVRATPSLPIIKDLLASGAKVTAHDPMGSENFRARFPKISKKIDFTDSWKKTVENSNIIVLVTCWIEYRDIYDLDLSEKTIFDCRGALDAEKVEARKYLSIGASNC